MASNILFQAAPANHSNGLVHTGPRAVPAGFQSANITIQCTTGNPASPFTGFAHPFNSAAMSIEFGVEWSWDGGTTWSGIYSGTQQGSPTGIWGTDQHDNPIMVPNIGLSIPFDATLGGFPNTYRGGFLVSGGPLTFGYTVTEYTA